MIGMSEVIMPVVSGMEFPLPLAPLAGEGVVSEQGPIFSLPPKKISQWEQFEDCSQSLELVVKSLGDGIAKEQVLNKVEFTQVGNVQKPQVNPATSQSIHAADVKEVVAIESPRTVKIEHAQVKDFEKPVVNTATSQRVQSVDAKEVVATESPNAEEIKDAQINCFEKSQVNTTVPQPVQAPESVTVSRLVDAIVEKIAVSSSLMATSEGEIRIQLKSDVLDGSSIKLEVKNGELKVVVEPASHIAEQILIKSQETFQNQLAERVTAWRVNVGIAAFDSRSILRRKLEKQS